MSPARELLLRGATRVKPKGWAHPALGGHDWAPRAAGRPADPPDAGPGHRRTRRGRRRHRTGAPPLGPGRPDAPNSGPATASGPEGSDLIPGGRQGDFLAPARFQRQAPSLTLRPTPRRATPPASATSSPLFPANPAITHADSRSTSPSP